MIDIKIAKVCGLCAGCTLAINTTIQEINKGSNVTIFKEIVHNKNVNNFLNSSGAYCEDNIENLPIDHTIILRAHGEPPKTYEYLESKGIKYIDCTCPNVTKIHNQVKEFSSKGYKVIILGKYKKAMHPEVLGTIGWASTETILIESTEDISKLEKFKGDKFYLVCQTTFNIAKADSIVADIENLLHKNNCELIINKSLCNAQRAINDSSAALAKDSDMMIVVGGANSSNSIELYNNVNSICPSIFIEDIFSYRSAMGKAGITLSPNMKIGITAGASTRKEELIELKELIEKDYLR